jgi:hypothetical protein
MRFFLFLCSLAGTTCLFPCVLFATTIVPYANLGEATANSECVLLARAISYHETADGPNIFKQTRFEVLEAVKGDLTPGGLFELRPMSHRTGDFDIDIAGDFDPALDKEYLLFLRQNDDVWAPVMLSYYVFAQIVVGGDEFLVPIAGDGLEVVAAPGAPLFEPLAVYQSDLLLQNLLQHKPGKAWDGSIGRSALTASDLQALDRAIPVGCDFMLGTSNYLARWQNAAVPVYYDDTNVPTGWVAYFNTVLGALTSNYTGIAPSNAGTTSYTPDCTGGAQGGNFISFMDSNLGGAQATLIIFDDPCGQMAALINCGGVLAFGGTYTSSNITHTFDGQTWRNARYGYVVINDGVLPDCWPGSDFERMLSHELTHVYRMDHLDPATYPNQNMNPACCNAINTKDRECMNYAYPLSLPVELSFYEAQLLGKERVALKWTTQTEKDNAYFTVQRSVDGISFETVAELPGLGNPTGGNYAWIDEHPQPGLNYYLLSQTDFDGRKTHLGIKSVEVLSGQSIVRVIPNPVADASLKFRVDLPRAFDGFMQVVDKDGKVVFSTALSAEKGSTMSQYMLPGLISGVYTVHLYDGREQFCARFTKK